MYGDTMKVYVYVIIFTLLLSFVIAAPSQVGDDADSILLVVKNEVKTLQQSVDDNTISVAQGQSCGTNTCIRGFDEFGILCAYASPIISVGSCKYNNQCSSYSCGKGCTAWLGCWSCSIAQGRNMGTGPFVSDTKPLAQKNAHLIEFVQSDTRFDCPTGTKQDFGFLTDGWVCRR